MFIRLKHERTSTVLQTMHVQLSVWISCWSCFKKWPFFAEFRSRWTSYHILFFFRLFLFLKVNFNMFLCNYFNLLLCTSHQNLAYFVFWPTSNWSRFQFRVRPSLLSRFKITDIRFCGVEYELTFHNTGVKFTIHRVSVKICTDQSTSKKKKTRDVNFFGRRKQQSRNCIDRIQK